MKKLMSEIKKLFLPVKRFFSRVFGAIGSFWVKHVRKALRKTGHALTHNPVIRSEHSRLILFSFIKIKVNRKRREAFYGIAFVMLWIIGYLVFTLYPMFYSFYLSFHEAYYSLENGVTSTYVGFQNYLNIFQSETLLPLFGAYIGKMLLAVPLIVVFSIMISVLINNPIRLKGFWRMVFFLPVVIASGPVISELADQGATTLPSLEDSALLLYVEENIGHWLATPMEAILTSMLQILWFAGIPILVFLAGLQKVDTSIYEAAAIDGASPWDRFWKITLPSINPLISVNIIYIVVAMSLFAEDGSILYLAKIHMLVGGPDSTFWHGYGYAAAIAWIYFFLMVIIMGIFIGLLSIKKKDR